MNTIFKARGICIHECNSVPPLYLIANHGLFDSGQILQRLQENMGKLGATNILYKVAEFTGQGEEDFIFVIDRF